MKIPVKFENIDTHLDGSILRGCDHDIEHGVEDDPCDWSTVPTQGVSLWWTGDPLLRVPLLTHRSSISHVLLHLIQLRLQLHHLENKDISNHAEKS